MAGTARKLLPEQVTLIRKRLEQGDHPADLAQEYEVSRALIIQIRDGKKHPQHIHRVVLRSGGEVVISFPGDPFLLLKEDRAFLERLALIVEEYNEKTEF